MCYNICESIQCLYFHSYWLFFCNFLNYISGNIALEDDDSNCTNGLKRFAAASSSSESLLLVSGGLAASGGNGGNLPPLESYFLATNNNRISIARIPLEYTGEETLDFVSMVHHSSISIGNNEFLLIGGGATSFAFGHSFARYVLQNIKFDNIPVCIRS